MVVLLVLLVVVLALNAMFLTFMGITQKGRHEDFQTVDTACESRY